MNQRQENQCLVDYAGLGPYSELEGENEEKQVIITAAKAKPQTFKGINYEEQCLLVADDIQVTTHAVHITPCYKKLTFIMAGESSGHQNNLQLPKRSSDGNSIWVYQEVCRF